MTHVKICGLRRVDDAVAAANAGADFLGLVFAPSRRRIEPDDARDLVMQVKPQSRAKFVGVFVNAAPEEINRIACTSNLDYAQLSGTEPDEFVDALDLPAIQVFHVPAEGIGPELAHLVETSRAELVLLDTAHAHSFGGTGQTFDWAGSTRIQRPFLLAGGLHAGNVADAMRALEPWGLDVSSGVETDGQKDTAKIREFIAQVRFRTG